MQFRQDLQSKIMLADAVLILFISVFTALLAEGNVMSNLVRSFCSLVLNTEY